MTESEKHPDANQGHGNSVISGAIAGSAGAAVGLALGGPSAVGAAALTPVIQKALEALLNWMGDQQRLRAARLIELAAKEADMEPEGLVNRLSGDPDRAQLFFRTIRAAVESGSERKLIGFARSVAVLQDSAPQKLQWEAVFVATVNVLEDVHLRALDMFDSTAFELGLGSNDPDFMVPVKTLNRGQLLMAAPELEDYVDTVTAVLTGQGLLAPMESTGGMLGGGQAPISQWTLTQFGEAVLQRLRIVGEAVA